jgi:hypothetical protein
MSIISLGEWNFPLLLFTMFLFSVTSSVFRVSVFFQAFLMDTSSFCTRFSHNKYFGAQWWVNT